MKVVEEAKKRPWTAGIALASLFAFFILWRSSAPTLEFIVRLQKAPDVAEAALDKATDARDWIDAYIAEQQRQREFDQKLAQKEADYQQKMLELQQQQIERQAPNQAPPQYRFWHDEERDAWWCCPLGWDCESDANWQRCG